MTSAEQSGPRISPFTYPKEYVLPARPSAAGQALADAHRQTGFLLAADLSLFERGMNLELRIVADSRGAKYRTPALAALLGLWSRSFVYRSDVCLLATRGSYASCVPLLRAAADCIGAQKGLASDDGCQEFIDWLATAFGQDREHAALEIGLGRFRSGSALAIDERLGKVYRAVTELTMTHFGATLLQTAPDASRERLAIAFGEGGFHLGWAQLILGWLLTLTDAQIAAAAGAGVFAVSPDVEAEARHFSEATAETLARDDRCRLEETDNGRFLISNFRRLAGAAPRKILL